MKRRWPVAVAGLLLACPACARRAGPADDMAAPAPADETTVHVSVTNHASLSMEISAAAAGISLRLGLVAPGLVRTFVLPPALAGNGAVVFFAQPSGTGPVVRADPVIVDHGDIVDFEIATNLIGSRATVRVR